MALDAALIADLEFAADPDVSADGARVAWTTEPSSIRGEHACGAIWVAPTDGSGPAIRFTADGDHRDHHPRWSPDGTMLAFCSDRATRGTDALMVMPADGGEARTLVARRTSVEAFAWSPDGTRIAFIAVAEPSSQDEQRIAERDDADVYGERWDFARLYLVDVASGEMTTVPTGDRHVTDLAWSPAGDAIAFSATATPELDAMWSAAMWVHELAANAPLQVCPAPGYRGAGLCWIATEAGQQLVWIAPHEPTPQCGWTIWSIPAAGGTARRETSSDGVCEIGVVATADRRAAIVLAADGLGVTLRRLGGEVLLDQPDADIATMGAPLAVGGTADRPVLAAVRSTATQPPELWVGPPDRLRQVSDHQAAWRSVQLARQEPFLYAAGDGRKLDGVIVYPSDGGSDGPWPTIVHPHGGPYTRWSNGFHGNFGDHAQWLAAAGYAVLLPNYRGGLGHGNAFATAGRDAVGGADLSDVMAMVDAAIDAGIADPQRLGIGGWSQGGHLAAWAVTQTDRFAAAMVGSGVSDWGRLVADTDMPTFEAVLAAGHPWDGPGTVSSDGRLGPHASAHRSAISFASKVSTPVLILHGEHDARVPVGQAVALGRALRHHGAIVEQVIYPREPHAIRERTHQMDVQRRVRAWFDRWL